MTINSNPFDRKDRPTWDDTWFDIANIISQRSLCKTRVGAVIVTEDNRPISVGYNGPPKGFNHYDYDCRAWCKRAVDPTLSYDECPSLHAEQNALMTADKSAFSGGYIYVTSHVCGTCAKLIANSGLRAVFVSDTSEENYNKRNSRHWYNFLEECGIWVVQTGMTYE